MTAARLFARDADSCGFIEIPFDAVIAWGEAGGRGANVDVVKPWELYIVGGGVTASKSPAFGLLFFGHGWTRSAPG